MAGFATWLDTFVEEKGFDGDHVFVVPGGSSGMDNYIPLECVIEAMKKTCPEEQAAIKAKIVQLDFKAPTLVLGYFERLAGALAI